MYAEWYHRLRVTDSTTLQQQQQHQPEHYGRMFVFIRCLAVCLSVCMSIGICMLYMCVCSRQSVSTQPVVLFCRPVLSPICLHTRHIRGYSTTSLGPHPLPNPLSNPLPLHGNQEPQELKSQLSSRRNTTTGLAEYSPHRKQLQRRSIVQSHNITGGQSTAERHHIIPRTTGLHAQTSR